MAHHDVSQVKASSTPDTAPPATIRARRRVWLQATRQADPRVVLARRLDMLAGAELQHGHHHFAEHLARRAQALRDAGLQEAGR